MLPLQTLPIKWSPPKTARLFYFRGIPVFDNGDAMGSLKTFVPDLPARGLFLVRTTSPFMAVSLERSGRGFFV